MKVFIFGAGASKGATKDLDGKGLFFPETNELFNSQYSSYWRQVFFSDEDIDILRNEKGEKDFEQWLTEKWLNIQIIMNLRTKNRKLREFARLTLYFWNLFNSLSNLYQEPNEYRKLINILNQQDDEDYGFISFNYDTFLDQALIKANGGSILSSRKDYYAEKLVKPHGSVNWFLRQRQHDRNAERKHDGDIQARLNLVCSQMYDGVIFNTQHITEVSPNHNDMNNIGSLINERFAYQYFYPLLFAPLTSKMTDFVEKFYEEKIEESINLIKEADEIFVIGYKARDEAIRKILIYAKPKVLLHVVSRSNAELISTQILSWAQQLKKGRIINGGFSAFNSQPFVFNVSN